MKVKILGKGCPNCHKLEANTKAALENLNMSADVEMVTDIDTILSYGVMSTPAIVVNETVVSVGKVLDTKAIERLFSPTGPSLRNY